MAENERRIDQAKENIAALLVDLVGRFCRCQRFVAVADIVRLDRCRQRAIELTLFGQFDLRQKLCQAGQASSRCGLVAKLAMEADQGCQKERFIVVKG